MYMRAAQRCGTLAQPQLAPKRKHSFPFYRWFTYFPVNSVINTANFAMEVQQRVHWIVMLHTSGQQ